MTTPLRICVAGCGRVSRSHLAGMREVPDRVEVAAVVSGDANKREEFCRTYAVPRAYANLEEALEDPAIEAVDLCVPNHRHRDLTVQCAQAGRHVLVEKPMANTVRECEDMIRASQDYGVKLMVGQSRRFHRAVFASRELLDRGEIGRLVGITGLLFANLKNPPTEWWRSAEKAGGLMIPLWGNHILDYVLWMFAEKPTRVYCEAQRINENWEGEDEVALLVGFEGGRFATIRMSWNTRFQEEGEWEGRGKMLSSADIVYERYIQGSGGTMHLGDETELRLNGKIIVDGPQVPSNFALQAAEFASAVREDREPLTSGRWAIELVRIQEAALRSAASHQVEHLT